MFFGTISGGAGAALTGGNFWQGAVTGLVVSGLNHAMHRNHERNILNEKIIAAGYDPDATQNMTLEEIKVFAQKVFGSDYSDAGNPFFEYSSEIGNNEGKVIFKVNNINGVCSVE